MDNTKYIDLVLRNNNIENYHVEENVKQFIKFLLSKYSDEELVNFYRNISTLKIKSKGFILYALMGKNIDGCYDACTNEIAIKDYIAIFHELFHFASTCYFQDKKIIKQGFMIVNLKHKDSDVGSGLNEYYTEYLSQKNFCINSNSSYIYGLFLSPKIEMIIGEALMEKLYLTADLDGLLDALQKYSDRETAMKFIRNMDQLIYHEYNPNKHYEQIRTEVYYYLCRTYLMKVKYDVIEGLISNDEAIENINNYIKSFSSSRYHVMMEMPLIENYTDLVKIK